MTRAAATLGLEAPRIEGLDGPGLVVLVPEHGVEDRGLLGVARNAYVGDGDEPEPRVLDPTLQLLGHHFPDEVRQPLGPRVVGHWSVSRSFLSGSFWGSSVVFAVEAPPDGQQLHLGAPGDQPFAPVEHVGQVPRVASARPMTALRWRSM